MILHFRQVLRAAYYGSRWRLKRFLRIPDRPRTPVLSAVSGVAFERYSRICRLLVQHLEDTAPDKKDVAVEVGSGDCLASANLMLSVGFKKVYLVEKQVIVVDENQRNILLELSRLDDLPDTTPALLDSDIPAIDTERIVIVPEFFEEAPLTEKADFIFSFDVLEHVEDLGGFFRKCAKMLKPDGFILHKFDLSGHEFFEDPIPPLDFQTYPDWLYELMFPKYRRACRRFLDEITDAAESAGFIKPEIEVLREADHSYVQSLKPSLRRDARKRSVEQLAPLDVVIKTRLRSS